VCAQSNVVDEPKTTRNGPHTKRHSIRLEIEKKEKHLLLLLVRLTFFHHFVSTFIWWEIVFYILLFGRAKNQKGKCHPHRWSIPSDKKVNQTQSSPLNTYN
jgi:hypothetical protein